MMKKVLMVCGVVLATSLAFATTEGKKEPSKVAACDDCSVCRSDQYCCKTANGCVGCFPTACP